MWRVASAGHETGVVIGSQIVTWDGGRLAVNRVFAELLKDAGLTTVAAFLEFAGGELAKQAVVDRRTDRIRLDGGDDGFVGFLKRHRRPRFSEYLKAWLRLTRPLLGARVEWDAIWQFHEAGLPTMTPVAFGECAAGSFVLTESLEPGQKLSAMVAEPGLEASRRRRLVREVAGLARRMHEAGLHHQDFYLGHLLCQVDEPHEPIFVLDLGRARRRSRLGRRWIIKDLAQLHYSSRNLTAADRLRFLNEYLGRRPGAADQQLMGRVVRKSRAIARHSLKHRL